MDIREKLTDFLEELDVKYFAADKLEGSDYEGYICVYIDSDDFSIELIEELGFRRIKPDFYYMEINEFEDLSEETKEEIKLIHSEKYNLKLRKDELRSRFLKLREIWTEAANKILEINLFFLKEQGMEFFAPTLETLDRAFRLPFLLVIDEMSCHDFCYYLYQVSYESVIDQTKDHLCKLLLNKNPSLSSEKDALKHLKEELVENNPFYEDIINLRNHYIHIKGSKKDNPKDKSKDMFNIICQRRGLSKVRNDYEYFQFQVKILNDFLGYLKKIDDIIKTKI